MDKETIVQLLSDGVISNEVAERYFPELKESERIRKEILDYIDKSTGCKRWVAWLEKQGEQKPCMIQWKGDNLKEVIDFTGKDKNFEKWFKSFEEYEKYVQEHDGIFKLFNADGSHYEVPVGAWIVKTPDGYNVVTLEVGDLFKQAWKGCLRPMWFKVLSINRPNNSLRVECHSFGGDYHEEEWDDLDVTENAFSIGEYKMMEV